MLAGLLRASIGAALLIPLLLLARRRRLLRPGMQYALWLVVALRLLLPVQIGVPVPALLPQANATAAQTLPTAQSVPAARVVRMAEPGAAAQAGSAQAVRRMRVSGGQVALCVWLAGACAAGAYAVWTNAAFRQNVRRRRVRGLSPDERAMYVSLCARLGIGRAPEVDVCEPLESCCLYGVLRPRIAVNLEGVRAENLEDVLAHELCHLRAGDPIWSLLRTACLCLYWFHPLVWAGARACARDGETACDARVVSGRDWDGQIAYGRTLLRLARTQGRAPALLQATAMRLGRSEVKERIETMLTFKRYERWAAGLLAALMLALGLATCAVAEPTATEGEAAAMEGETAGTEVATAGEAKGTYDERARAALEQYLGVTLPADCVAEEVVVVPELEQVELTYGPVGDEIYYVGFYEGELQRVNRAHTGIEDFFEHEDATLYWAAQWGEDWLTDDIYWVESGLEITGEAGERMREIEREAAAYAREHGLQCEAWTGWWETDAYYTGGGLATDVLLIIRYPNGSGLDMNVMGASVDVGYSLYSKQIDYVAFIRLGNG